MTCLKAASREARATRCIGHPIIQAQVQTREEEHIQSRRHPDDESKDDLCAHHTYISYRSYQKQRGTLASEALEARARQGFPERNFSDCGMRSYRISNDSLVSSPVLPILSYPILSDPSEIQNPESHPSPASRIFRPVQSNPVQSIRYMYTYAPPSRAQTKMLQPRKDNPTQMTKKI